MAKLLTLSTLLITLVGATLQAQSFHSRPKSQHYISTAITAPVRQVNQPGPNPTQTQAATPYQDGDHGTISTDREKRREQRRQERAERKAQRIATRDAKHKNREERAALGNQLAVRDRGNASKGR